MKRKRSIFLICFIIAITACFLQNRFLYALNDPSIQKKRIAVLEINTNNIPSSFGNIARNAFEVFLFNSGNFQLLDRERQQAVAVKQGITPSSENSLADLLTFGKNISADYLVSGNVDKLDVYKITIRVISVTSGEIITVRTQTFSSTEEFDDTLNNVSGKIKNDIIEYIQDGRIQRSFFERHDLYAGISFNYLIPISNLGTLINSGPGINGAFEISNMIFSDDYAGLHTGYYRFNGKKNNHDEAQFIMLRLAYGYRYNLFNRLYLKGEIEGGMNWVTLDHNAGNGFNFDENSQKKAVDPLAQCGVFIGINPFNAINLEAGIQYGIDFERGGNLTFLNLSIGLTAFF